jgi:uncharacterized repeat protein (TIGR04138 family)
MNELAESVAKVVRQDPRYAPEAYLFVFEALSFAHSVLGLGGSERPKTAARSKKAKSEKERHLTGQELCEAIRQFALEQYGYMAKCVLNSWGVRTTGDFGEIVFNLIRVGQMRKTAEDKREDFDDNFDFDGAFMQSFRITIPD